MKICQLLFSKFHCLLNLMALVLAFVISHADTNAQPSPVTWGPTMQISNTPTSAFGAKIAVVGDTVHVIYHARALYYRRSINGGKTWESQVELVSSDSMAGQVFNRPLAASGSHVYVVYGNNTPSGFIRAIKVRQSTNAGATWLEPRELFVNIPLVQNYRTPKVAAAENYVYVVTNRAAAGGYPQAFLLRSTDAGATWDSVRQISFGSAATGTWDIAAKGSSVHLTFERNVQPEELHMEGEFRRDQPLSAREIGHLYSTDHGLTWSEGQMLSTIDAYIGWDPQVAVDASGNVYVSWIDAKYGSIGGFAGSLLMRRSADWGQSWLSEIRVTSVSATNGSSLVGIGRHIYMLFGDERDGFQDATISYVQSHDYGKSWCSEIVLGGPLRRALGPMIGEDQTQVYAIWSSDRSTPGDTAHVFLRRADIAVGIIETSDESRITSLQNYPNPFNEETTIVYELSSHGNIQLTLYDILGNEVRMLVDEGNFPGRYTYHFNAHGLASGAYFIKMKTSERLEVRRILLLR